MTAFENIMSGQDDKGKQLICEDIPSIRSLIGELHLEQDPKRDEKLSSKRPLVPEQVMCQKYADLLIHTVSHQIQKENNPLMHHLGEPLLNFMDFGHPSPEMWTEDGEKELVKKNFHNVS